ncbi:M24 family metallopeptidase [Pararhizobium antarcticum]|uniref:Proline dipeptidase n=1 Tax=Pararhizobium antarcticum TaxID=1798805 RepID=A0A657LQW4_9HYPH|nr:Xaa-Pro peptidase family protein [Pararhizobium antarcticum]OJF91275.1 hypothetical protein AX760_07075 [Pararhizobium antarcticum]OJG01182.1 hypothetical protein AX761_00780 [Rhizobium sp. 58]
MAHINRQRAMRLMQAARLDALLLLTPESFSYATGATAGVATMWRRSGAVAAIVPADETLECAAVVTDLFEAAFRASSTISDIRVHPIWVETGSISGLTGAGLTDEELMRTAWEKQGRTRGFARPETFDATTGFRLAADLLSARRLAGGRIGVELDSLSVTDFQLLAAALPEAELVDASNLVQRLKMIKSPQEIGFLQTAVELAEAGIEALHDAIVVGRSRDDLAAAWKAGVVADVARRGVETLTGTWEYISVGENPWTKGGVVAPGALIKVDVGCLIAGYTSDTGRTFIVGEPSRLQARLFDALRQGFEAGLALLRPGKQLRDVHRAASDAIGRAGFPDYTRGHFGHGLGASLGSEEWPFISAKAEIAIEPGMVLAFETPWYVDGVGGMIIENQYLITATGQTPMNRLPTGLVVV